MYSREIRKKVLTVGVAGLLLYGAVYVDKDMNSKTENNNSIHTQQVVTNVLRNKENINKQEYKKNNKIHKISMIKKVETKENNKRAYNYLDIPLNHKQQDWVFKISKRNSVDPYLIFAIMKEESNFINMSSNSYGCTGLLQINQVTANDTLSWLYKTDRQQYNEVIKGFYLNDNFSNIHIGICTLKKLFVKYGDDIMKPLLCYGLGVEGARQYIRRNGYTQPTFMKKWFYYQEQLQKYGKIIEEYGR
jgi:soluble lytic murein transglycosylase